MLAGNAPELAEFYPIVGGDRPPEQIWPAATATIDDRFQWLRGRVALTVQTNEPGPAAVIFAALLWLVDGYGMPIRLLEIGSSAGLNLLVDRYSYVVDGVELGDPTSPLRFVEPWTPGLPVDLEAAAAGCGSPSVPAAISTPRPRTRGGPPAAAVAASGPTSFTGSNGRGRRSGSRHSGRRRSVQAEASAWVACREAPQDADGTLTVVWHLRSFASTSRPEQWELSGQRVRWSAGADRAWPWCSSEPSSVRTGTVRVVRGLTPIPGNAGSPWCGDHGPPLLWQERGPRLAAGAHYDWDWIVVGSGFGGSVAALRLAEKGYSVCVNECGRRFADDEFARSTWELRRFLYMPRPGCRAVLWFTPFKDVAILSGAGVGGGSLGYANTLYRAPSRFFEDPQWAGLADWEAELGPHYDTAERMLGMAPVEFDDPSDDLLQDLVVDPGVESTHKKVNVGVYFGERGATKPDPFFGGRVCWWPRRPAAAA